MLVLLLLPLASAAPSHPVGPPPPPRLSEVLDTLTLDAATRASLDDKLDAAEPELEALHEALRTREEALLDDVRAALTPTQRAAFDAALAEARPPRDGAPPAR